MVLAGAPLLCRWFVGAGRDVGCFCGSVEEVEGLVGYFGGWADGSAS